MTTFILAVRNPEQQALMLELDGQLSDGFWENAKPYDHWKTWSNAEVIVDPANVGRSWHYAAKDNYDLTAKALLDVVQLRMLATVRIARKFGYEVASILEHAASCDGTIESESWNKENFRKATVVANEKGFRSLTTDGERKFLTVADFVKLLQEAVADESYTLTMMRADLRDLKVIFKTRRTL